MRITPGLPPLPDRSNDAVPQTGTSATAIGESPPRDGNAQSPDYPLRPRQHSLRRAATLPSIRHLPDADGALSTDLRHNFVRQRVYDHAVAIDQLSMNSYAARRRKTLNALPGAEAISAQYGISLASYREDRNTLAELRFDSPYTGKYQREFQSERFHADCLALYEAQGGNPNDNVVFVHSDDAAWQMMSRVETITGRVESARMPIITIAPGLTAIRCGSADDADILDKWTTMMGARPSAYRIASLTCPLVRDEVMDPGISNRRLLARLRNETPGLCIAALRAIPEHHSAHALAQTSAALIADMAEVLERSGKAEVLEHSAILASGLQSLIAIAEAMPPLAQRSDRFANAYQAMIEELQVVLMAARPYGEADFKQAAHDQFATRMGTVAGQNGIAAPEIFLTSSGMGALAWAFELAADLSGHDKVRLASSAPTKVAPDYYEIMQLLRLDNIVEDSDVVSATLNPSTTEKRGPDDQERAWNVHVLIGKLDGLLHERQTVRAETPLTVVLDTTIERRGDMQALLDRFSPDIAAGRVRFLICKSYQKYANLATAKVMAGSIALLSADDATSDEARHQLRLRERATGWAGNDEMQLLIHFLRSGDPHEFTLLERAASNADFVRTACFGASAEHLGFDTYDEGLPLARMQYAQTPDQYFRFASGRPTVFTRPGHLMDSIATRDSFAFASTTKINVESSIRLSFGLESRGELMEMFYTPGLLMRTPRSAWGTLEARKHVMALVDSAMKEIDPDGAARTPPLPLQDKIARIGVAEAESQDMEASLSATTQRMRANLHRDNARSRFTVNRIASVVEHMARVIAFDEHSLTRFRTGKPDRKIADELLDGLINAGMPGVSERTRTRIVAFRATLAALDWTSDDPSIRLRGVQSLLQGVRRLADADKRAKYLAGIPDAIFREVPDATRAQLIDQMFRPLDADSRQAFLDRRPRGDVANACKAAMGLGVQSAQD
ncbi:hypothetical protein BAR24066_01887 [Burkholderia arboris]|uniref:Uncharacterized protein n=1 Tax=Burkholderia arboris TaxID=488730 RepID=A0A9Q9SG53_9BURK|nr:hypothetical protein [Burkholderia arboris]VWB42279.1 hypothetical protein BAR24066_01887 [Burkholderia arboris]